MHFSSNYTKYAIQPIILHFFTSDPTYQLKLRSKNWTSTLTTPVDKIPPVLVYPYCCHCETIGGIYHPHIKGTYSTLLQEIKYLDTGLSPVEHSEGTWIDLRALHFVASPVLYSIHHPTNKCPNNNPHPLSACWRSKQWPSEGAFGGQKR